MGSTRSRSCATWGLSLLALINLAHGALYTDVHKLPTTTFDFVIVGAGAAGNVIANRLTENPSVSVLVIEAGINNEGVLTVEAPFLCLENIPFSGVTWNYTTVPQAGLGGRNLTYSRGRILGGSSSINFMTYTRGSNDDYDRWAKLTGDQGWSWNNLAKYYFKSSRLVPSQGRNIKGLVNPLAHGFGPIEVSLSDFVTELDARVVNTSKTESEFAFNLDFQSGNSVGVSLAQSTIGNGERSSSATAYLQPVINRKNLHVLIQNTVTRLVRSGSNKGTPAFQKVELAPSASAPRSIVTAKKEVILSAGAIGTPQILMLSGIGDRSELSAVGIPTLVQSPDVGKNLQDHPILSNYFTVNSTQTFDEFFRNTTLFNANLAQWQKDRTGPFANSPGLAVAFLRLPDNSPVFSQFKDPVPGKTTPHLEMIWADGFAATEAAAPPASGNYLTINTAVVSPLSTGSMRLASSDPFTFPLINPNFFTSPFDQFAMIQAIKAARRFVQTPAWADFVIDRFGDVGGAETDEEILAAARRAIVTIWHPTCTARMSPANADWGVLDPQLRVKGASGLRVVDASAFPIIPPGHPVAFVYVLAERAADLIKSTWHL